MLKLNTRAILQVLRESGVEVANTSASDLEIDGAEATSQDTTILSKAKDSVRDWVNLSADKEGGLNLEMFDRVEGKSLVGAAPVERVGSASGKAGPGEAVVEGEALGQIVR